MSVLLTNVSSKLLPLLASPAFLDPPAPTVQNPNNNATQLHALSYATFCGEVVEAMAGLGLGAADSDTRGGDGLRSVRDDLASMVGRVVTPLLNGLKHDLMPLIEALEHPAPATSPVVPRTRVAAAPAQHPSLGVLQALVPVHAKALSRYCATPTAQTHLATFTISVVWRALLALAHRPPPPTTQVSSSPVAPPTPKVLPVGLKKPRTTSSTTPPNTPPALRFGLKLPPSRPPSPPNSQGPVSSCAGDARALLELFSTFPQPNGEQETTRLAREATDEAFDALRALAGLLEATRGPQAAAMAASPDTVAAELARLGDDLPALVALPVVLPAFVHSEGHGRAVHELLGMTESEYRKGCLAGFGRAEEYAPLVGGRVLEVLHAEENVAEGSALRPCAQTVIRWLEEAIDDGPD
jgi:hypothetical protein